MPSAVFRSKMYNKTGNKIEYNEHTDSDKKRASHLVWLATETLNFYDFGITIVSAYYY